MINHIDTEFPELKPCRVCATPNPRVLFGKKVGTDIDMYRIMCDECGNNSEIFDNEMEVVEAWNHRKLEAPV